MGLSEHLRAGGALVMLNPRAEAVPARLDGVNTLFIDREGTGLSLEGARALVAEARERGCFAVVRADGIAPDELAQCAELAPDGMVLPQLRSAEELAGCMAALGGIAAIAQIETVEAVDGLAALTEVPGVAAYLIGPYDLADAMGHGRAADHPHVVAAVDAVARQLADAGRPFGLPTFDEAARRRWQARGAQLFYVTPAALAALELPL